MRRRLARLLAAATGVMVVLLAALFAWLQQALSPEPDAAPDPQLQIARGQVVYAEQQCQTCHAIEQVGNRRYPLDGVGSTLSAEDIRTWIVSPREMNPRVAKRPFTLPPADLDALVAYLVSLKEK